MRHSHYITLVAVAALMSWTVAAHLTLVAAGQMTHRQAVGSICQDVNTETSGCVIRVDRENVAITDIALHFREPIWRLIIDNPLLPIGWTLSPGTSVYVRPRPVEPW
jgi:hypothetical protein